MSANNGGQGAALLQFHQSAPNKLGKEPLPDGKVMASIIERRPPLRIFEARRSNTSPSTKPSTSVGNDAESASSRTLTDWQKTDLRFDRRGNVTG